MADDVQPQPAAPTLRRRKLAISANVLIQVFAALALVVMLNWLVSRHYSRFDWTKTGYYKISEKTKQALASLREPVKIVVFLQPSAEREFLEKTYQDVRNLLKEFQFFGKGKLDVEYVDPQRQRARAEQLIAEYKVDVPNVVIFACGNRNKYVNIEDMVEFDASDYTQRYRVKAFKGEGAFLAAIQTVTEETPPKVYFLTGHGERDPESFDQQNGYSALATYIKRDNITVAKWNLLEKQAMPTDAGLIVIAGPRKAFAPAERNALEDYLKNKGRLFLMLDPRSESGLEGFLQKWGVRVDNDLVAAKGGTIFGTDLIIVDALGAQYASHPITRTLQGVNTTFPYARSIGRAEGQAEKGADQPRVTELVKTPAAFWGQTDLESERAKFDPAKDIHGPLTLAVAVEAGRPHGANVDLDVTRMIIVGTSGFVNNSGISGGNLDFFMNSVNWLLQREQLIAVGPKVPDEFRLDMSPDQIRAVYALVMAGMPLGVATLGLLVWTRRRK
jgi:ABC-type uncharacterized transport system involved in gliding motility auxiliary subunit